MCDMSWLSSPDYTSQTDAECTVDNGKSSSDLKLSITQVVYSCLLYQSMSRQGVLTVKNSLVSSMIYMDLVRKPTLKGIEILSTHTRLKQAFQVRTQQ